MKVRNAEEFEIDQLARFGTSPGKLALLQNAQQSNLSFGGKISSHIEKTAFHLRQARNVPDAVELHRESGRLEK